MIRRRRAALLLTALSLTVGLTGCSREAAAPQTPMRVACVGDSITAGFGLAEPASAYPAQLQALLGSGYLVENFGVNGAAAADYADTPAYAASLEFAPDVVVLMLGSNDASAALWQDRAAFSGQYLALITAYQELGAQVILCTPSSVYANSFGIREQPLQEICAEIRELAQELELPAADIQRVTAGHSEWYRQDGVHPDAEGAAAIAGAICPMIADCA